MSATNLILALLIFQTVCLLEPVIFILALWLLTYSLMTGTSVAIVLRNITVVEDDIFLPHPPGFLNTSNGTKYQDDIPSFMSDYSETSSAVLSTMDLDASSITDVGRFHPAEPDGPLHECANLVLSEPSQSAVAKRQASLGSRVPQILVTPNTDLVPTDESRRESDEVDPFQHIVIPAALDRRPVFSRRNVTNHVIFPVRKQPSSKPRGGSYDSFDVNSVLKRMPSTWIRMKPELPPRDTSLCFTTAETRHRALPSAKLNPPLPERDPYDSWPYIRTAFEEDHRLPEGTNQEKGSSFIATARRWTVGVV